MTSFLGFPLLPLWIMGAPLIGALISLAMPAPRLNTMPRNRRRDETVVAVSVTPTAAAPYPQH